MKKVLYIILISIFSLTVISCSSSDGGRKVSFHSIRHSVETHLTNQNVNPRFIDFLQGHSQKGIGGSVYMKGIQPEVLLKECVEKIDWGIDWEKLKVKWK
jgi:intergrase/recombinase